MFGSTYRTATKGQRLRRRMYGYRGRGGYWGRMLGGMFGKPNLGSLAGDIAASGIRTFGGPIGNAAMGLANAAGNVAKAFGIGDYKVERNALVNASAGTRVFNPPQFRHSGTDVLLSHCEFIGNLYAPSSTTAFSNTTYSLNPGLEATFPWFSQIAANYDEYEMKQCIVSFKSTITADVATSGQTGQVIMATQYNTSHPPFNDKMSMMQYAGSVSAKSTDNIECGVECDPGLNSGSPGKYVRTGPLQDRQDPKEYDQGTLNIAVSDIPAAYANQQLGEIWISYTIVLRKPRLYTGRGLAVSRDLFFGLHHAMLDAPNTVSSPIWWTGAQLLSGAANSIGCTIGGGAAIPLVSGAPALNANTNRLTFPDGYTGSVKIIIAITSHGAGVPFNGIPVVHSGGGALTENDGLCALNGNVRRIEDIVVDNEDGTTGYQFRSSQCCAAGTPISGGGGSVGRVVSEYHIHVDAATYGVKNYIDFFAPLENEAALGYAALALGSARWGGQISVEEYNVTGNDATSGHSLWHNDIGQLVDPEEITHV
jgi:hypothetical protein